ncbi:hypothetical protein ACA910_010827 [Epithemia clementina (nom. ined.)]
MESFSLAGPYLVGIAVTNDKAVRCQLYQLTHLATRNHEDTICRHNEGALAWSSLMNGRTVTNGATAAEDTITVEVEVETNQLVVQHCSGRLAAASEELWRILSRILVQFAIKNIHIFGNNDRKSTEWMVLRTTDDGLGSLVEVSKFDSSNEELMIQSLFRGVYDIIPRETEVAEMVDQNGNPIGQVPRKLVHKYNLLHRGIGLFVSKDHKLDFSSFALEKRNEEIPSLYVHQRTATKRIFPSLYDMFVGGVSIANEESKVTAQREVAEELGLVRGSEQLSDCLGTCVVCTSLNRCVVDLFSYTMNTDTERVSWQDEEVAWGGFVPYEVVQASANLSVQRLVQRKEWPGRNSDGLRSSLNEVDLDILSNRFQKEAKFTDFKDWTEWDFVPDGLLVWEAWLNWVEKYQRVPHT